MPARAVGTAAVALLVLLSPLARVRAQNASNASTASRPLGNMTLFAANASRFLGNVTLLAAGRGCHNAKPGEACYEHILWAKRHGVKTHPQWYPGLHKTSSMEDFQQAVHTAHPGKCPPPCIAPHKLWCHDVPYPKLWSPKQAQEGVAMKVKVLTYNLFWWNLFGRRHGNHHSAGKLITRSMHPEPYDLMGFQECEKPQRLLEPVGLQKKYTAFLGPHAICAAYRTATWQLLAHGEDDVAEDMKTNHYGRRGAMWLRLRHRKTGRTVFFVNHHGPLAVNSGGLCGGRATAHSLMKLMTDHARHGDVLILVGDFNANAASLTIQSLWPHLVHNYNGKSFGGVDNMFSNIAMSSVLRTENLGSGGSDHDALSVTFQVGGKPPKRHSGSHKRVPANALQSMEGAGAPRQDWPHFWCGLMESGVSYVVQAPAWSWRVDHRSPHDVASPSRCCRLCQKVSKCHSWRWEKHGAGNRRPRCWLQGGTPARKFAKSLVVSGLPAREAAKAAARAAATALKSI